MDEACIYLARMGKSTEARKILDEFNEASKRTYVPPSLIAAVHVALGENDQAFTWLEKAYSEREPRFLLTLKVSPWWDPLRSDPRFPELLRKIGLEK